MRRPRRAALGAGLALLLVAGACSDDGGGGRQGSGGDDPDHITAGDVEVLRTLAEGVIIPSYEALVTNVQALADGEAVLCATPDATHLDEARQAWRDAELAWESTRATGVGPAVSMRSMQAIAFRAAPAKVEALIAGSGPVDPPALESLGADVRGINGVEVALFAPGSDVLTGPAGARWPC